MPKSKKKNKPIIVHDRLGSVSIDSDADVQVQQAMGEDQTPYDDIVLLDQIAQQYGQKWGRPLYEDIVAYGTMAEAIEDPDNEWEFVEDKSVIWNKIVEEKQIFTLEHGYEVGADFVSQYLIHKGFVKPKKVE
jgi:hypothetical protein